MNKTKDYLKNEQGQALLFIIVALTVAMAIGMSVSTRTISSVRRSVNTDTSSRVYTAAEGGIEFFLRQPVAVLDALSDGNNNSGADCPEGTSQPTGDTANCLITYTASTGDNIQSQAVVGVSTFTFNNPTGAVNHYWFYVNSGEVKEVNLNSFTGTLRICWSSQDASVTPDLYYTIYNNAGATSKAIIQNPSATNTAFEGSTTMRASAASPYTNLDFTFCTSPDITGVNGQRGIRIKSLYGPSKVGVFATSGTLPTQGYRIVSTGQLTDSDQFKTLKHLQVYRSFTYLPGVFDNAIYSDSALGVAP